jgi:hypothetical protein
LVKITIANTAKLNVKLNIMRSYYTSFKVPRN